MSGPRVAAVIGVVLSGCGPGHVWRDLSPDHRTEVEIVQEQGQSCIAIGKILHGCYDGLAVHGVTFSDDGSRVAYPVLRESHWRVVLDGKEGPAWDGVSALTFSPGGERFVYAAVKDSVWRVVVDQTPGTSFDSLLSDSFAFDRSGRRFAYAGQRGDSVYAVIDGLITSGYEGIGTIRFGRNGEHVAFLARRRGGSQVVVDGVHHRLYEAISDLVFGPAGELAYAVRRDAQWWVAVGDKWFGPHVSVRHLAFRPVDGKVSYITGDGATERVVFGGVAGPWYRSVDPPVFSQSGHLWGYVARDSTGSSVVLNGMASASEEWVGNLAINPDGSRFAYLVRRGEQTFVVDDRKTTAFDLALDGTLVFAGDGESWACLAGIRDGRKLFVTVDGIETTRPFDWSEFGRLARRQVVTGSIGFSKNDQLQSWVLAEANLLLAEKTGNSPTAAPSFGVHPVRREATVAAQDSPPVRVKVPG